MAIIRAIEEIFQNVLGFNEYTKALVLLLTGFGALVGLLIALKLTHSTIRGKLKLKLKFQEVLYHSLIDTPKPHG